MNENIDLIKILENCPKEFPLYSIIYGNVIFSRISDNAIEFIYPHKTPYGIFKSTAYVNLEGKHIGSYNGECTLFPSKDQRDWSKFTAPWYKKEKFDPKTLQPFDKVLVRDGDAYIWKATLLSYINKDISYPYVCINSAYRYCIPYNEDTKHLIGTTDEAPEYYRYWED